MDGKHLCERDNKMHQWGNTAMREGRVVGAASCRCVKDEL